MNTNFDIDDELSLALRREAERQGRTMSDVAETALRSYLRAGPETVELPPLPTFQSGGMLVDVADRDVLSQIMEGR